MWIDLSAWFSHHTILVVWGAKGLTIEEGSHTLML
jgi:hypothetical protein